jgi:diguanylate cyclase (GGDEF)-like protein
MNLISESLNKNASLLRAKASRYSIIGIVIGIVAVIIASILSGYYTTGRISFEAFLFAQKNNVVIWFLDAMPFVFAFWGQYISSMISYEASAMVLDQTQEIRTQSVALEKKAAYEATHDSLTGLPNRTLFMDRLQQATSSARREGEVFAVFLFDIDRFKEVNDTLGHYNGDRLIKQVALRLSGVIRDSDTLARIGGDDFGFLLLDLNLPKDVEDLNRKIKQSLKPPFVLENLSLDVQASIGAVLFPEHGKDIDTLIQRADVAMYVAKHNKSGFAIYSKDLDEHSPQRLTQAGE